MADDQQADRTELLARARSFLRSPQVRFQDSDTKRTFLAEKGLTPAEVDQLLHELPPPVPPRTYPAPPPSSLPNLLAGVARIFTWLTGTSAIILFVYYRYLLPRLAQSYQARLALRKHQSTLATRLTESISALKAAQTVSYKDLPRPTIGFEDAQFAQCHSIDDLCSHAPGQVDRLLADIPDITILRCALEELRHSKTDGITTEELFRHLKGKLRLGSEDDAARQSGLWNILNSCPLFVSSVSKSDVSSSLPPDHPSRLLWEYTPPLTPPTPPLLVSLSKLQTALPCGQDVTVNSSSGSSFTSARQRTLQALSDFTGYITTQTYALGLPSIRGTNGVPAGANPAEEELRREIRALKGLVLNRRSFLPYGVGASGSTSDPS